MRTDYCQICAIKGMSLDKWVELYSVHKNSTMLVTMSMRQDTQGLSKSSLTVTRAMILKLKGIFI